LCEKNETSKQEHGSDDEVGEQREAQENLVNLPTEARLMMVIVSYSGSK
jgi:hypothetical protein